MAKVQAQIAGGDKQDIDAGTVGEAREAIGAESTFKASVNGEPADDAYPLRKNDFITFAKPVKAG